MKKIKGLKLIIMLISFLLIMLGLENSVEASMKVKDTSFVTSLYRNSSKVGFALDTNGSIERILKINNSNENSNFYFTKDVTKYDVSKNYNYYCNLKTELYEAQKDNLKFKGNNNASFLNTIQYNQLMWIVDHMYVKTENNSERDTESINDFINEINTNYHININNHNTKTNKNDLLKSEDIDVVQQLAIWHFTNASQWNDVGDLSDESKSLKNKLLITNSNLSGKYIKMYDNTLYREKVDAMEQYYRFLIENANPSYRTTNLSEIKTSGNKLASFMAAEGTTINPVTTNENYSYVAGPYKVEDNNFGVDYEIFSFICEAETTEGKKSDITNEITILVRNDEGRYDQISENGNVINDNLTILEKLKKDNREFYLAIGNKVTNLKSIDLNLSVKYHAREAIYYSVSNPDETDAPIIKVEEIDEFQQYSLSTIFELTTEMDFTLRQFISAINGNEIKDENGKYLREPNVDISYLNKRVNGVRYTTANYNQTKDTIKVSVGDVVTFTIRVYNEGGVNGYVSEITDYLPPYLEFINDEENSSNGWMIEDADNLRVIRSRKLEWLDHDETGNAEQRLIRAFDGSNLQYREIKLKCKVIDPNATDSITSALTSIRNNLEIPTNTNNDDPSAENGRNDNPYGSEDSDPIQEDAIQYADDIIGRIRQRISEQEDNQENGNTIDENTTGGNEEASNTENSSNNTNEQTQEQETTEEEEEHEEIAIRITNIAEITEAQDAYGNAYSMSDRDSKTDNLNLPVDDELPQYRNEELRKNESYVKGQEDDDDFEKLQMKSFDFALRQFITKINDTEITSRIPNVDIKNLNNGTNTTATYNHSKEPMRVDVGDTVILTIRIYNEGEVDGYCDEITEHIPEQLEFIEDHEINQKYEWSRDLTNRNVLKTRYLSKQNDEKGSGENIRWNKIPKGNGEALQYRDVQIALKVVRTIQMTKKITCFGEITDFIESEGNLIRDKDSIKANFQYPIDWQLYKEDSIKSAYVAGEEDDDDFEKIIIGEFDLSLREFISKVNGARVESRIPQVDIANLQNGTGTTATYNQSKEVALFNSGDTIEYTIRVYNEGDVAGYASEIKEEIPEGLEFIIDDEVNKSYEWKMYDKDGQETENSADAKLIITQYLSRTSGEEKMKADTKLQKNPNLINSFDINSESYNDLYIENIPYKDVKVTLMVKKENIPNDVIENRAYISKAEDENADVIADRDSTVDVWNDGEDDQDAERIRIRYFNLTLKQELVETTINKLGIIEPLKWEMDKEDIKAINVDVENRLIEENSVNFKYKITIKNDGTIPGYAAEIKDYIPDGLEFFEEDNELWKKVDEKEIITEQTNKVLLQPGESTEVYVILSRPSGKNNKENYSNYAEISKIYNEFDAIDIDSTPDNGKNNENDVDKVTITFKTKNTRLIVLISIVIGALILVFVAIGIIKKFIL